MSTHMAKGKTFYKVVSAQHSPDHKLVAYAEDEQGSEIYTVRVKDLASDETLAAPVTNCTGDFAFSPDGEFLFWTYRDDNGRPAKIYRRPARGGEDVLVYDEPDDGFFLGVNVSESREWIHDPCRQWRPIGILAHPCERSNRERRASFIRAKPIISTRRRIGAGVGMCSPIATTPPTSR